MEKIIRDGKVAVAISPGFGAGWSTWCDVDPMDAKFNQLILDGKTEEIYAMAEESMKGDDEYIYTGGLEDVEIVWVPVGTKFYIDEYDGSESLVTIDNFVWKVA